MADSNLSSLAFQRETSWGVPPATVALQLLRMTKESLEHSKDIEKSSEIRSDRRQGESVQVGVTAKGSVDFELAVGDQELFLESALMGAFADVAGTPTLRDGTTRTSYVLEKKFVLPGGNSFTSFRGAMVDTLTLNLASKKIVTGTMGFLMQKGIVSTVTIDSAGGYTAAGSGLILSASTNVGNIKKGVGGTSLAGLKDLSITINNSLRGNDEIGRIDIGEVGLGSIMVTGKTSAYFRTPELLDEFMNHASSAISFEISRAASGATTGDTIGYRITIPKLKWTKGFPSVGGKDQDVMLPLEFDAEVGTFGGAPAQIAIEKLLQPAP